MRKLFALLAACMGLSAHAYTQIAECVNPAGTGGAYLFTDGQEFILQVATVTTQMEEFRTNAGQAPRVAQDIAQISADLRGGNAHSFLMSKDGSILRDGILGSTALIHVQLEAADSSAFVSVLAWRGQSMTLRCSVPGSL